MSFTFEMPIRDENEEATVEAEYDGGQIGGRTPWGWDPGIEPSVEILTVTENGVELELTDLEREACEIRGLEYYHSMLQAAEEDRYEH